MDKKRDRLEIIRDILLSIQDKKQIKPTRLLHSSNLSPQMFKEYISLLSKKEFIEEQIIPRFDCLYQQRQTCSSRRELF